MKEMRGEVGKETPKKEMDFWDTLSNYIFKQFQGNNENTYIRTYYYLTLILRINCCPLKWNRVLLELVGRWQTNKNPITRVVEDVLEIFKYL